MKRLLFLLFLFLPFNASAVELSVMPFHATYQSNNLDNDTGIRLQLGHANYFLWGSLESSLVRFGGQQCVDVQLIGAGLGVKTKPFHGFSLSLDGGYFFTDHKIHKSFYFDGAWYAFAEHLIWQDGTAQHRTHWDHYDYQLKDGFGGSVGAAYRKSFFDDRLTLGCLVGYRYLRLEQAIRGWNGAFDASLPHWEVFRDQDFSSIFTGLIIGWKF